MRVVLLFIDGVGIGPREADRNPLARESYLLSHFDDGTSSPLPHDARRFVVDTTFGVKGRPQSASNQAAIYTASRVPQRLGRHALGFPTGQLKNLLLDESIVRAVAGAGRRARFVNAFPAGYLEAVGLLPRARRDDEPAMPAKWVRRARASASLLAMHAAGVPLFTFDELERGWAVPADVDGATARRYGAKVSATSAEEAAQRIWREGAEFVLFEHSLADEAGHAQDFDVASRALRTFDELAREVLRLRPPDGHVFICSDHGNVEDLSTRNHTRNPVSVISAGSAPHLDIRDLADVGRAILQLVEA